MDNFARYVHFQTHDIAYSKVDKLTSGAGDVIRICFLSGMLRQGYRHVDPSKKVFYRCISYNGVIAPYRKGSGSACNLTTRMKAVTVPPHDTSTDIELEEVKGKVVKATGAGVIELD